MDAVEFIKTRARMCREYDGCAECPLDFFCECEEEHQEIKNKIPAIVLSKR